MKPQNAPALLPGISSLIAATNELLKVASSNSGPVFISGEVGTERSFAAKLIHQLSPRASRPMSKINVSWKLPPDLRQYVEQSRGGTIILNLQKEFPIDMQYTLVEMASHGSFADPLSGDLVESDVRMILVTTLSVEEFSQKNDLLPELKELIESQHIVIPPLRSRPEDIPALVRYATMRARDTGRSMATGADPQVLTLFRQWHWPGNAEDLLLVTAQAAISTKSDLITLDDLPESFNKQVPVELLEAARQVRNPRSAKPKSPRTSGSSDGVQQLSAASLTTPVIGQNVIPHDAVPISSDSVLLPMTPTPVEAASQVAPAEAEHKGVPAGAVSPRVIQLARRLNAQSMLLSRQMSGPLAAESAQKTMEELMALASDEEALNALENQLDRGLDMVLSMRRQVALLNLRQQQSAETIRDLVQRLATSQTGDGTEESNSEAIEEARELADSLRTIETIMNRVSTEVPMLGKHLEATLSGNVPEARPTTSGIFKKPDFKS